PLRLPLVPRNGCGRPGRAPERFLPLDITSLLLHVIFDARLDRKSGSAGMPRPISYAVFCLKKKTTPCVRVLPPRPRRLSATARRLRVRQHAPRALLGRSLFLRLMTPRRPSSPLFPYTTLFRSAFTLAFSTSQRLRTTRASARTFFTFRHYIPPSARNF